MPTAQSIPHTDSYYAATANRTPEAPALAGETRCDVCVVGAGISGLSTALHLAERGYDVVVLEQNLIGWGASGRSGGQVITGYACEMSTLEQAVGRDDARRLWDMSLEAVELLRDRVERHRIQCDLRWGHAHLAIKTRQQRELESWAETLQQRYGYTRLELLGRKTLGRVINSSRYRSGVLDHGSGHVHPLNYTLGLAEAAASAGARLHQRSPAVRFESGPNPVVHTPEGRVDCRYLVFCGNAYLGALVPALERKVMPVGTYIIGTEPLGEDRARQLMPANSAAADVNFVLDYFRLSADHRMLFGGKVSYSTHQPADLAGTMRSSMLKVFPELVDVRVDYAWGGFVAITMNRAPCIGRLGGDVYFAQGFSGHGMALTGLAGKVIAEAIAGTAERLDLFGRISHRTFPGGRLLRMPALVLAMAYYRLRDFL